MAVGKVKLQCNSDIRHPFQLSSYLPRCWLCRSKYFHSSAFWALEANSQRRDTDGQLFSVAAGAIACLLPLTTVALLRVLRSTRDWAHTLAIVGLGGTAGELFGQVENPGAWMQLSVESWFFLLQAEVETAAAEHSQNARGEVKSNKRAMGKTGVQINTSEIVINLLIKHVRNKYVGCVIGCSSGRNTLLLTLHTHPAGSVVGWLNQSLNLASN